MDSNEEHRCSSATSKGPSFFYRGLKRKKERKKLKPRRDSSLIKRGDVKHAWRSCDKLKLTDLRRKEAGRETFVITENLERELDECHELLEVSEVEVSKLNEMLSEKKTEKPDNGADLLLLDSLRAELRSRDVQIEQMEEYLNQVCVNDTEVVYDESGTDKNVVEGLKSRVEELENQVEKQRDVISEREEEKREAIRELCFSLDHYKSRYIELVSISLSGNN